MPVRCKAAKVFDDQAAEYDKWFADSLLYRIELAALRSLQTPMGVPRIEIGVGPGHFARDLGVDFGMDPARAPLLLAHQRGIVCCQGVGEALPFKDRTVNSVYLLFTLCYASDPQKIVDECSRILCNGGHLAVGMIPAGSKWGKHLDAKKKEGNNFYEHAHFYTVEIVRQWLTRANMSVIEYRSTLYQAPGRVEHKETAMEVLDECAGFVVIVARKKHV